MKLPPIKKNSFGDSKGGFRYDASNKRSGSAALNRRKQNDIFNDIPDTDSNVGAMKTKNTLIRRNSNTGRGSRGNSITEKPGNMVFVKEGMQYQERTIGKRDQG